MIVAVLILQVLILIAILTALGAIWYALTDEGDE
jgi:hypothetical protein